MVHVCVCLDVTADDTNTELSSTTTSASTFNCSPRWIVSPHSRAHGATHTSASTQQQCLDACVADSRCVVAEWSDKYKCWIHNRLHQHLDQYPGTTRFEIVRRCNRKSSTRRQQVFLYRIISINNITVNFTSLGLNINHLMYFWQRPVPYDE